MSRDQALIETYFDDFIVDIYRNVLLTYHGDRNDNDFKQYEYTLELIKKYGALFSKYINTLHCDNGNYLLEYITRNILCYSDDSPQAKYVFNWCIRYANVNATNKYGCTVLHTASNFGDKYIMKKLISKGANIDIQNNDGETPLSNMVDMSIVHNDCVRIILKAGADPNTCNKKGYTPLRDAIRYDNVKCIQMLLKAGADPNTHDEKGITPLDYAINNCNKYRNNYGNIKIIKLLLDKLMYA